jgi:GTP-binding protein Era
VGKSTLVNRIVGAKVAIVSDKPQTTRRAIRGVATQVPDWQLVLTDLPGVQRPRDRLTERMQARVESELAESDGVLFVVNGEQGVGGPGDKWIAEVLSGRQGPDPHRRQQGRPAEQSEDRGGAAGGGRPGLDAEIFP